MKDMKLTKLQRHTAYIILWVELKWQLQNSRGLYNGFCHWISETFDCREIYDGLFLKKTFPELYRKGDKIGKDGFFVSWPHWNKRLSDLEQCIKQTA